MQVDRKAHAYLPYLPWPLLGAGAWWLVTLASGTAPSGMGLWILLPVASALLAGSVVVVGATAEILAPRARTLAAAGHALVALVAVVLVLVTPEGVGGHTAVLWALALAAAAAAAAGVAVARPVVPWVMWVIGGAAAGVGLFLLLAGAHDPGDAWHDRPPSLAPVIFLPWLLPAAAPLAAAAHRAGAGRLRSGAWLAAGAFLGPWMLWPLLAVLDLWEGEVDVGDASYLLMLLLPLGLLAVLSVLAARRPGTWLLGGAVLLAAMPSGWALCMAVCDFPT